MPLNASEAKAKGMIFRRRPWFFDRRFAIRSPVCQLMLFVITGSHGFIST